MKKNWIYLLLWALPSLMLAQLSVSSDFSFDFGSDPDIIGIDAIIVFQKVDESSELIYTNSDTVDFVWHYHTAALDSQIVSSIVSDTITVLDSLEQGLYELIVDDTISSYYYVIDFSEYQPALDSVWVDDSGDSCNFIRLNASLLREDIPIYDKQNDSTHLLLTPSNTIYNWISVDKVNSPSKQDAPFNDTVFFCTPYSDDFFDTSDSVVLYTNPDTMATESYIAIAVNLVSFESSVPDEDDDSNALQASSVTEGSAPLDVTYTIEFEGDAASYWWVWSLDNTQPSSATYRYQETVTHTFSEYKESGYRVKLLVGNDFCQVEDSTEVKVYESDLQVPNILVLGFGASAQFKVAHTSIDPSSFKASVYDRWGRLVHKWDNIESGWDGRSPVTGAYVSPGAYYYNIRAEGTDGRKYKLLGDINVVRERGIN